MISLLTATDLELHYNHKTYLNKLNFVLHERDVIGLVGRNGCGKTTLLRILAGQTDYDGGKMEFKTGVKVGYLPQDFEIDAHHTVQSFLYEQSQWIRDLKNTYQQAPENSQQQHDLLEKVSAHHGFDLDQHIQYLCHQIGVNYEENKLVTQMSGGQQRRLALVSALVGFPDILILDEPTNHLDITTIETLEKLLKGYAGAVLIVSHDRYFLDNVATKIWEMWQAKLYSHNGGYSKYLESKAIRLEIANSSEWKKQQFLKRELEWVRAGVKARSTKDKGRLKRFYTLKDEAGLEAEMQLEMVLPEPKEQGSRVLEVEKIYLDLDSYTLDEFGVSIKKTQSLVHNFTFSFQPGQRIGIVGPNGVGKTSFIKMLMGMTKPDKGTIKIGINTDYLYFEQKKVILKPDVSAFDFLGDGNERMPFGEETIGVRKYLAAWMFDYYKYTQAIKHLSGGEKSRLIMAKMLSKGGNFLVLDEPTNDLDLDTLRILEESLQEFEGTSLIISHDRYFLNRVCNYIFGFEGNGAITISTGNYDQYLGKKMNPALIRSYREMVKQQEREVKQKKRDNKSNLTKIEEEIAKTELKLEELNQPFGDPDFYIKEQFRAVKLHRMISDWERELNKLMTRWEQLQAESADLSDVIDTDEVLNSTVDFDDFIIKPVPNRR
jgi:ABC transport system ATP-binding/permease protein